MQAGYHFANAIGKRYSPGLGLSPTCREPIRLDMTAETLRLCTRASPLALWQSGHVRDALLARETGLRIDLVTLTTRGDRVGDRALAAVGGKGLFTKELEDAMLDGRADLAVHSLKDLPTELPPGLTIGAILPREDPRDAMVGAPLADLAAGALVGTSSLRRSAQLLHLRPDLRCAPVRGNVDTRLRKLDEGQYDALCMAGAGLSRLGYCERIAEHLDPVRIVPAVGQGAIAVECRRDDAALLERLARIHCPTTAACVMAERGVLGALAGGCLTPIGAHATMDGDKMALHAVVCSLDGATRLSAQASDARERAEELVALVVAELRRQGADALIAASRAEPQRLAPPT